MGSTFAFANDDLTRSDPESRIDVLGRDELRHGNFREAMRLANASIGRAVATNAASTEVSESLTPETRDSLRISSARTNNVLNLRDVFVPRTIEGRSVNTLQEWEGVVDGLEDNIVRARLRDLSGGRPEEVAEIPISEIPPESRDRLSPGAIFHFIIGFSRRNSVQRREAIFYFRKYPPKKSGIGEKIADLLDYFDDEPEYAGE